jgi:uncharacterized delta-60 repeat protein
MRRAVIGLAALGASLAASLPAFAAPSDPDRSFSDDGRRTVDLHRFDSSAEVLPQGDGKVVLVGDTRSPSDLTLMRFRPGGRLDESFAGDGVKTSDWGEFELAYGAAMQEDGKIVVVGSSDQDFRSDDNDFLVARYLPGGNLDKSFSGNGMRTLDFGADETAFGVALGDDGSIVAAGETTTNPGDNARFAVAGFESDGGIDESFSTDGKLTTKFSEARDDRASGVAIQDDGRIVVAGWANFADFGVVRYGADGELDDSFAGDGKTTTDFHGDIDQASGLSLQDDGRIVLGGHAADQASRFQLALARYETDGDLDMTFSGNGRQTTAFADDAINEFGGLVIDSAERIVIAGEAQGDAAVARFESGGPPDSSFSGDGRRRIAVGRSYGANATAVQADDRILLGGSVRGDTSEFGDRDFLLARLLG